MRLADIVAASRAVAGSSGRLSKIAQLADLLKRLPPADLDIAIPLLSGSLRQGRLGIGRALVSEAGAVGAAADSTLELGEVDAAFARLASTAGAGATAARAAVLRALFERATGDEQDFLRRLLFGEIRQGALEGVLVEAVALASRIPADRVRRAAMLAGALPVVARIALTEGDTALSRFILQPFHPVQPMLADSASDVADAMETLGGHVSLEYKLDGARIQVHKQDDEVRVYSRALREVTAAVPEVVEAVQALPARTLVLDGEVLALRADGVPHPFQVTMRRFGRRLNVEPLRAELPLTPMFFDALYLEGSPIIDEPLSRRRALLDRLVAPANIVPHLTTSSAPDADAFAGRALAAGHEGVMAKAPGAAYAAGRRGSAWLKVKRAHTLDLVVLAAEWGSGRRRGTLSNLHLGARDERRGFVMLGKTFKGLTDEMLAWQTDQFLAIETGRDGHIVYVRPTLVVEIAFNDIQVSPQYPGGLALRFARVKRYRPDKTAAQADTFAEIQRIYREATGLDAPEAGTRVIG